MMVWACRGEASGDDILGSKARYFPDASLHPYRVLREDATRSPLQPDARRDTPSGEDIQASKIGYLPDAGKGVGDGRGEASGNDIRGSKARYFPDASPLRAPRVKWENRVNLAGRRNRTGIIILQDGDCWDDGGDGRWGYFATAGNKKGVVIQRLR